MSSMKKAPWWNPAKWFEYRKSIPIEQRSYTKIYGVLAMLLFAFTVWAVLDEVLERRPWKDIQADFKEFKVSRLKVERKKELAKIPNDVKKKLRKELSDAKKALESDKNVALAEELSDLEVEIKNAERDYTFTKSEADEVFYHFDEAKTARHDTTSYAKTLRELEKKMAGEKVIVDALLEKKKALVAKLEPVNKRIKAAQDEYDKVFAGVIAIDRKIEATEGMTIGVKQTVLLNYEKTNFNNFKMRVDRCETCHLSYADPLFKNDTLVSTDAAEVKAWLKKNKYNDEKHYTIKKLGAKKDTTVAVISALFRLHPKADLLIKGHKVGEPAGPGVLGCASCHGGQASSIVSTEFAHGFEKHWTEPLTTGKYVEASCQSCHSSKFEFEGAEWITMGKKLFVGFGCYGCHPMPGYETTPGQGPSLTNLSKKVTPDWTYQWILNPRGWEHGTRMPNFVFTPEESKAVTAYLWDASKDAKYIPAARFSGGGDAIAGKQAFFDVGCVGCHTVDEWKGSEIRAKDAANFGPGLDKVGSKVTAEWLFDWIKNPKNYLKHARMPSMRLTDGEAANITAYLMTQTGKNDSVSSTLSGNLTDANLIRKGGEIIKSYGCYGCHEIKGTEGESKVSVALNTFGKKTPNELAYGNIASETFAKWRADFKKQGIPLGELESHASHGNRDWYTWVVGKMKNSRMYQTERLPQKMPNFDMSDKEAYAISVFLKSQDGKYMGPTYADNATETYNAMLSKGRFFAFWNNCTGCHKIEGGGGEQLQKLINNTFAGDANIAYFAPPYLKPVGARLQEEYLHNFLKGPSKVRPIVKFRMPTFGFSDADIATATNYFLGIHKQQLMFTQYQFQGDQSLLAAGKALYDKINCLSCHSAGAPTPDTKAPSFALAKGRLKPDWVEHWIARPDSIMPGTPMTAFWWTAGKPSSPAPDILGGDIKMQIHAVHTYIQSLGNNGIPAPTPYATINGVDKYVMPNGDYRPVMTNATPPALANQPGMPLPKKEAAKSTRRVGKPTASK